MADLAPGKLRSPLKVHGGKSYLAPWIIGLFPPDSKILVEPYCGGCNVTLRSVPYPIEVINDLDPAIMNFWTVLRDRQPELSAILADVDYDEDQFLYSQERCSAPADSSDAAHTAWAAHTLIVSRFSRGGMGREFAWSDRLRGGQPGDANAWETIREQIPAVAARLRNAIIMNQPAIKVVREYRDCEEAVIFLDPPYLPCTRKSQAIYRYDLTARDHMHLLDTIRMSKASIYLSGYPSDLYSEYLPGWDCVSKVIANHSSQATTKEDRIECIWSNRALARE